MTSQPSWISAPDVLHRGDERALDLGAGRVAAGVHDPRDRVAAFAARAAERAVDLVEVGAERHELAHARRALAGEHRDRVGVAQPGAGGEGVGAVERGRVVVLDERGGHATLRVAGGRPRRARPW